MRGTVTLFQDIFQEDAPSALTHEKKKGRSATLHSLRNECLIDRYYYYGKFTDRRYLSIIEELSKEFFISTVTIPDLLTENIVMLQDLKAAQPIRSYFVKKWPHLVW